MLLKKVSPFVLGSLLSLCLGTQATLANAAEWTMKISHAGPVTDDSDDHHGSLMIKEYVEKHSNGRIQVEIYPANQLGSYKEVVEQVQANVLEVAHTSIDGVAPFVPEMTLIDLPYSMPDDKTARAFMRSPFLSVINAEVAQVLPNVLLASITNGGNWRSFYTTKKQVNSVADLKGLKIRTINSPLQQELVRQVDANPTVVAWGELYTALATGVTDGLKIAINDIVSNKMDEHINYGILDMHTYLYGFYWLSRDWLNSLPTDLQKVVLAGLVYGAEQQANFNENIEMKAREIFTKNGGTIVIPNAEQKAEFAASGATMEQWYVEKYGAKGKELLDRYKDAIKKAQASVN